MPIRNSPGDTCGNDGFRHTLAGPHMLRPNPTQAARHLTLRGSYANRPPAGPRFLGLFYFVESGPDNLNLTYRCALSTTGVIQWELFSTNTAAGSGTTGTFNNPTQIVTSNGLVTSVT